ncbi:MAG TPA: TonB-dependent receptor, partial [Balneolaceae bacterium]|nr:TonB-dependent receptor [Balneolaceae bacterium]
EQNVTGSVSQVNGSSISQQPVENTSQALTGNVSGVSVGAHTGQPGHNSPTIHIRGIGTTGNSKPLVVVDGIERNYSALQNIDPSSIKSVSVLKDAAAVAQYGMSGANGVVLITTKQGQAGKPSISFNAYYGTETPTYYPKMLKAQDFMRLKNEAYLNANPNGQNLPFSKKLISNYKQLHAKNPDKYPITNNAGKKYENLHPPMTNGNMQISGGTDNITYYGQFGYHNEDGMFPNVNYHRYNYTVSVNAQATPTTKVDLSVIGTIAKTSSVDAGTSVQHLFRTGFKYKPILNMYYSNGKWGQSEGNSPIGMIKSGGYQDSSNDQIYSKISIKQKLFKGLSAKAVFSYNPEHNFIKNYHRPFYYWSINTSTNPPTFSKGISTSEGNSPTYTYLYEQYNKVQQFTYQGYLNYKNNFGKNNITGLFVAEGHYQDYHTFNASRNHFKINLDELNMGPSNRKYYNNGGYMSSGSRIGFVYQFGYNYNQKYFIKTSGRYDGTYLFAPGHRFGYFPAVSGGIILSKVKFLRKLVPSFLNFLKLRGSWGKSGNVTTSPYQYLNGYNLYGNAYAFGNNNLVSGSYIPREANHNITWEVSTKTDVGLDAKLFNSSLSFSFDYFHDKRTRMLLPPAVTVPVEYGLSLPQENAGIMANNGVDVSLKTNDNLGNGFNFSFQGNFSYAHNKMLQIFETPTTYNNPHRRRTGRAYQTPFGLHAIGIFSKKADKNGDGVINSKDGYNITQFGTIHPGDIKYADVNGDGKINQKDNVPIGYPPNPEITFGFTPQISWKGLSLSLFFQGAGMVSKDVQGFLTVPFFNNGSNSAYEYYNHRWTPNHQNARYPRATPSPSSNNTQYSDFWVWNASYLRLKNAVLGYTLPVHLTTKLGIQKLRFYVSGHNLLTFSKINFMDPQNNTSGAPGTGYPIMTRYIAGINIKF